MTQKLLIAASVVLLITGVVLILKNNNLVVPQVNDGRLTDTSGKTQDGSVASELNIQTKTIKEDNNEGRYTIDVQYPEITGFKDSNTQKQVNEKITNLINNQVTEFKKSASESLSIARENDFMSGLDIRYNIAQVSENIVSLSLEVSNFAAGAAHPNNYNLTLNYQPSTNKELTLSDLFKPDSNYLDTLSKISREDLNNQFKDQPEMTEFINPGTEPKEENFKNFVLKPKRLELIFDPYQVAPYAAGTRTVSIEKEKLNDILNPDINF